MVKATLDEQLGKQTQEKQKLMLEYRQRARQLNNQLSLNQQDGEIKTLLVQIQDMQAALDKFQKDKAKLSTLLKQIAEF